MMSTGNQTLSELRKMASALMAKHPRYVFFVAPCDYQCDAFSKARDAALDLGGSITDEELQESGPLDLYYADRKDIDPVYTPVNCYSVHPIHV